MKKEERAELKDYKATGYDRGHMASAQSLGRSRKVMDESFYLSNMCPQLPALNRGKWKELEEYMRSMIFTSQEGWIITGPIFKDDIGKMNRVTIPSHFYKIFPRHYPSLIVLAPLPNS